jgi:hypothetical protein
MPQEDGLKFEPSGLPIWDIQHIQEIKPKLGWVEIDTVIGA